MDGLFDACCKATAGRKMQLERAGCINRRNGFLVVATDAVSVDSVGKQGHCRLWFPDKR